MSVYPAHEDVDAVLRDGSTVHIRPVVREDREPLHHFLEHLSVDSRVFRFFTAVRELEWAAERFVDIDYRTRHGLVALRGPGEEIVAHGLYVQTAPGRAEVAIEVADELQGMGLGTILLGHLAQAADAAGIGVFEAEVLAGNHRMLQVLRDSGLPVRTRPSRGVIGVEMPTSLTEEALDRFERREQLSAIAALRCFLEPRAIAMIGASSRRGTVGGEVFHNLVSSGFPGPVYPVSRRPVVQSVLAYGDVREVPGEVELAVVAVPAPEVAAVARACAEKGVRALVVISTGYAESGPEGLARQEELIAVCRESGMRLVGPNCMGIANTDPGHRLNATLAPELPPVGRVGFLGQGGALGLAIIAQARSRGLGLSAFLSVGNKADISGNDLLEYWSEDPRTDVILLYLESFGNPRRFSRTARRVSRVKPVVAVKGGRARGVGAAGGSLGSVLLKASDVTVDALFRQAGVIRAETLAELFDTAALLAAQPAPAGRRVAVLTNASGPALLCTDACVADGLEVAALPEETAAALAAALPGRAAGANPVDLTVHAPPEEFERAIAILAGCPAVDALVVIFVPSIAGGAEAAAAAIGRGVAGVRGAKPVLSVFMSAEPAPSRLAARDGPAPIERWPSADPAPEPDPGGPAAAVPTYAFPEDAARALANAAAWARWRDRPGEPLPALDGLRRDEAGAIVASALASGDGWLALPGAAGLLDCYGIRTLPWRTAASPREAVAAARHLGGDVVLGPVRREPPVERGAAAGALAARGDRAVRRAARELAGRAAADGGPAAGVLVQAAAPPGVEVTVGVVHDPLFGPVIVCGSILPPAQARDAQVRLTPLGPGDADEMIRGLAALPALEGDGGRPSSVAALRELLLRVGALVEDQEEVSELDLSPVIVGPGGAVVGGAWLRVGPHPPGPLAGSRSRARPGPSPPAGPDLTGGGDGRAPGSPG